jgi:hypothetical protein
MCFHPTTSNYRNFVKGKRLKVLGLCQNQADAKLNASVILVKPMIKGCVMQKDFLQTFFLFPVRSSRYDKKKM